MKYLAIFLLLPLAAFALDEPQPRPSEDASHLPNTLFSGTVSTFAAIVSQTRETEENELRSTLDRILPVRGILSGGNGRKAVVFDRLVVWEGSTIPASHLGVFSRIYIVEDITESSVSITVQGSTQDESMNFILPVNLRESLVTVNP